MNYLFFDLETSSVSTGSQIYLKKKKKQFLFYILYIKVTLPRSVSQALSCKLVRHCNIALSGQEIYDCKNRNCFFFCWGLGRTSGINTVKFIRTFMKVWEGLVELLL